MTNESRNLDFNTRGSRFEVYNLNEAKDLLEAVENVSFTIPQKEKKTVPVFTMNKMAIVLLREFQSVAISKGSRASGLLIESNFDKWSYTFDFLNSIPDLEAFQIPGGNKFSTAIRVEEYYIPSLLTPFVLPQKVTFSGSEIEKDLILRPFMDLDDVDVTKLLPPNEFRKVSEAIGAALNRDVLKPFDRGSVDSLASINFEKTFIGNHYNELQKAQNDVKFIQINPDFINPEYLGSNDWYDGAVEYINLTLMKLPLSAAQTGKKAEYTLSKNEVTVNKVDVETEAKA